MSSDEIRSALLPQPGPVKRCRAARNRTTKFKDTLDRSKQNQTLENDFRTHILEPAWASAEACICCGKLLNCSTEPRNFTRRCPLPRDFDVHLLDTWSVK